MPLRGLCPVKKRVVILGSTGSIGRNGLEVLEGLTDEFEVVGLSAQNNWKLLSQQARRWNVPRVAIADAAHGPALKRCLNGTTQVLDGDGALAELVECSECETVLCAVVGAAGLSATYGAVRQGRRVALANKEALVIAGELLMKLAASTGATIIPIDSEHSAIFQALQAGRYEEVTRIVLTASGGPFRTWTREQMARATVEDALQHPIWDMGPKITIDSATMMNKALEIIEARWLFKIDPDRIEVVIHPESVVHSLVEFCDGSMVAQLGVPDMRTPIQYALTYPHRRECPSPRLDLGALGRMTFDRPDADRFPALRLGREAARKGGTAGAVLNAANEAAVELFRAGRIGFSEIAERVEKVVDVHRWSADPTLEELMAADRWAREECVIG